LGLGVAADPAQAKSWRERATAKADPAEKRPDGLGNQRTEPRPAKR
jgi:hypothetical protein